MRQEAEKKLITPDSSTPIKVIGATPKGPYIPLYNPTSYHPTYIPVQAANLTSSPGTHTREDVKYQLTDTIARCLRSNFVLPEKMTVGRLEYQITKSFVDEENGYIAISAWYSAAKIAFVKLKTATSILYKNEPVQRFLMRVIDGTLNSSIPIPSTITVEGTTYRVNYSYAPSLNEPLKEGWLRISSDANFVTIADVHLIDGRISQY